MLRILPRKDNRLEAGPPIAGHPETKPWSEFPDVVPATRAVDAFAACVRARDFAGGEALCHPSIHGRPIARHTRFSLLPQAAAAKQGSGVT